MSENKMTKKKSTFGPVELVLDFRKLKIDCCLGIGTWDLVI